jgi:hypothetical protein
MITASRFHEAAKQETELTIEKALEFAGDNSEYQKKRLMLIGVIILCFALLNWNMTFMGKEVLLLFLAVSGIGQLVCPVYLSFDICAVGMFIASGLAVVVLPFSSVLACICYLAIGFFGRGFFACSLLYLNEIGGERFRAWSLTAIFAIWGISSLLSAFKEILHVPDWIWMYVTILFPIMVGCKILLRHWKPSPYFLYSKSTQRSI